MGRRSRAHGFFNPQTQDEIDTFKSKEWRDVSKLKKEAEFYQCELCREHGIISEGSYTIHKIPINDDLTKRFDLDNLTLLCVDCHEWTRIPHLKSQEEYQKTEWRNLAKKMVVDAGSRCEECGVKGIRLVAHHIVSVREDWFRIYDTTNIQVLCQLCHNQRHDRTGTGIPTKAQQKERLRNLIVNNGAGTTDEFYDLY